MVGNHVLSEEYGDSEDNRQVLSEPTSNSSSKGSKKQGILKNKATRWKMNK